MTTIFISAICISNMKNSGNRCSRSQEYARANFLLKILVIGSNGFIGQYLSHLLGRNAYDIVHTYRHLPEEHIPDNSNHIAVGNIDPRTRWQAALRD